MLGTTTDSITAKGNIAVAVLVNQLSKYVYAVPGGDKSDAVEWANMYAEHVVLHKELSTIAISDEGPQFNTAFSRARAFALCLGIRDETEHVILS